MSHLLRSALPFALLASSNIAIAGAPAAIGYDNWTVGTGGAAAGVIDTSTSCGNVGVTCKTLASDAGFQYEEVTTPAYSFLRLILTDQDASGDPTVATGPTALNFSSETFTPFALSGAGIAQGAASKQVVRDAADSFLVTAEVQKGNMRGLNAATAEDMFTAKISQSFTDGDLSTGFDFTNYTQFATGPANSPDTNVEIGRVLDISQEVLTGNPGDTSKKQLFVQRQRQGVAGNSTAVFPSFLPFGLPADFTVGGSYFINAPITAAGSMSLPVTADGTPTGATNTVAWAARNDISTTWIAQSSNVSANGADLSYQRVVNNTTPAEATAVVIDIPTPTNPFDWDPNFGTEPVLP